MADTFIQVATDGSGKKLDTRTEASNSEHRQVVVLGDPANNTGVAAVDATNGLSVNLTNSSVTVAGAVTSTVTGPTATGASLSGNPVRVGLSDGTNAQNWLTALPLGDGVNGNNTAATAGWVWNGVTWDRMPGTTAGVKTSAAQSGTWTVQPGNTANTTAWKVDNTAALDKGAGTSGSATQRVILDSGQLGTLGQTTKSASVPVVPASDWVYNTGKYVAVAASQSAATIQASAGAVGDYLDHVVVVPATTAPGVVTILDNATPLISYPGGGTTALLTLTPFTIYVGAVSSSGAWKITTGANVSVLAVGRFS